MLFLFVLFFFKQKTAYEMRISDWSSDVCSSDLIGGSRASIANITAELLGIDYKRVSVQIGDTASIGFSNLTGGSRVLFASAMVVTESAAQVIDQMKQRAAKIWGIAADQVAWENEIGRAHV